MVSISTNSHEIESQLVHETFLTNKIDQDVQSLIFPLNLMQILVLNPKYRIKNNFISPNNCFNKSILLCATLTFLSAYVYRVLEISLDSNLRRYGTVSFLYFASYFDFIFYCTGFIMNFTINLSKTKKMVILILTFQEVHKLINNDYSFKWSVRKTWIYVTLIFVFYITIFLFMCFAPWHIVFNLVALISLDSNLIYFIVMIKVLTEKAKLWNVKIMNLPKNYCNDMHSKGLFDVYVGILKCYKILKNVFQQPVSLLGYHLFISDHFE